MSNVGTQQQSCVGGSGAIQLTALTKPRTNIEELTIARYLDVPFGEIQLSKVTSDAFALVPVVNTVFKPAPLLPDWYPIPAYAVTNPIFIDTNKDGEYNAPLPPPDFCSRPCNDANDCASGQVCLMDTKVCGFNIPDDCDFRTPWPFSH